MAKTRLDDELWNRMEPLLPRPSRADLNVPAEDRWTDLVFTVLV